MYINIQVPYATSGVIAWCSEPLKVLLYELLSNQNKTSAYFLLTVEMKYYLFGNLCQKAAILTWKDSVKL